MVAESPPDDAMLDVIVGIVMRGPQVIATHGGRGFARQQIAWQFFPWLHIRDQKRLGEGEASIRTSSAVYPRAGSAWCLVMT